MSSIPSRTSISKEIVLDSINKQWYGLLAKRKVDPASSHISLNYEAEYSLMCIKYQIGLIHISEVAVSLNVMIPAHANIEQLETQIDHPFRLLSKALLDKGYDS